MKLAYYITPHGFGHAVRSLEVIRHLGETNGVEIIIVSDLPEFLIEQNAGAIAQRRRTLDVGLIQLDSVRYDLEATLAALGRLRANLETIQREEEDFLAHGDFDGVVCDVPFIPMRPARRKGIPTICLGNFSWDWIYRTFAGDDPRWHPIADWIAGEYALADLLLRLPFHGGCENFNTIEDVPMIARRATRFREETRRLLGIDNGTPAFLLAFKDLDLSKPGLSRIESIEDRLFLFKKPLAWSLKNGVCVDDYNLAYVDLLTAADGVITKPGYGIVSDCLANGAPMIYCDRGDIPEYPILVEGIEKHLPAVFMPSKDLYAGNWRPYLEMLMDKIGASRNQAPENWALAPPPTAEGAEVCARRIVEFIG